MGAWGTGPFDNDDAADWVYALEDDGLAAIRSALRFEEEYVESPEASNAVAAAAVVAHAQGAEVEVTEEVEAWLADHDEWAVAALAPQAAAALDRVLGDSELAELHEEAGNDDWAADVTALRDLLRAG